jgi:hypothetical protein
VYLAANPAPEERRAINRAIGLLAGNRWVGGPRLPMIPLMDEADDDDPFAVEDDPATIRRAAALARWRVRRLARWDAKHGGQWPDEGVFA